MQPECDLSRMVIDQVGVAEVEPVLPQVRFALGFVPFVHLFTLLLRLPIWYERIAVEETNEDGAATFRILIVSG